MSAIFLIICVIPFTGICAADNSVEVRAILAEASSVLESDPKRASGLANRALKLCDTAHPRFCYDSGYCNVWRGRAASRQF